MDDCGGGYSESIAEMCEELQNALTPLLIVTPNGRDESGANRDCFLLNPAAKSPLHMSMFRFLGTSRRRHPTRDARVYFQMLRFQLETVTSVVSAERHVAFLV